jgi:hypothetical protein
MGLKFAGESPEVTVENPRLRRTPTVTIITVGGGFINHP